jgi:hypothetical protein
MAIVKKKPTGHKAYLILKHMLVKQDQLDKLKEAIHKKKIAKPTLLKALHQVQTTGIKANMFSKLHSLSLGQVFRFFIETWDELPRSFTQAYTDGVPGYFQEVYGYGIEMAEMYAKIWSAWFSGEYKFVVPKYVNVAELPVTKMHQVASYIIREEMTAERWRALADTQLTGSELAVRLRGDDDTPHRGPSPGVKTTHRGVLFWETGDIAMFLKGDRQHVGQFDTSSKDPLVIEEIRRIAKHAKLRIAR